MHRRSASYGLPIPDIVISEVRCSGNETKVQRRRPRSAEPQLQYVNSGAIPKQQYSLELFPLDVHAKEMHKKAMVNGNYKDVAELKSRSASLNSLDKQFPNNCVCDRNALVKVSSSEGLNGQDLASFFSYRVWQRRSEEDLASRCRLQKPISLQRSQPYRECGCLTRDHTNNTNS